MAEVIFIAIVTGLVVHYLRQLSIGRPARVGGKAAPAELNQILEYAERLFSEKKFLSAEKAFLRALKLDHKNVAAYRRLGLIYAAQKNYDEAIETLQIAAHLDPSAVNYHNLGAAYYENGNYVKAMAAFEKGLIFQSTAELQAAVGKTYLKMNNLGQAITALEKAADTSKPAKSHLLYLAEAYTAAGKNQAAAEAYRKVLKLDPTETKARRFLQRHPIGT